MTCGYRTTYFSCTLLDSISCLPFFPMFSETPGWDLFSVILIREINMFYLKLFIVSLGIDCVSRINIIKIMISGLAWEYMCVFSLNIFSNADWCGKWWNFIDAMSFIEEHWWDLVSLYWALIVDKSLILFQLCLLFQPFTPFSRLT